VYQNRDAATHIPTLEEKLSANPRSPVFARLASYYLKEGLVQKAVEVCLNGLKSYPHYATAHLVLGQCYESLGRNIEAMLEYRRALKAVPDNPRLQTLLRNAEQREQDAFKAFAEERVQKLKGRRDTMTFEQYEKDETPEKESTIDFLLRRLQAAQTATQDRIPVERSAPSEEREVTPVKIVTATLAEIYANQGEYKEAIGAYRKLLEQRPTDAQRYEKRIAQLEELGRLQQLESKT
jgi:tetratricopeptide (TPR) repeat protein